MVDASELNIVSSRYYVATICDVIYKFSVSLLIVRIN
jgi:hypothetical protein